MELLGHRCVCLYLLLMPNCFPCCMYRFTLASGIYRNCAYLPMFNNCQLFFFFCQFSGNKMDPYCDFFFFTCISPVTNEVAHLFTGHLYFPFCEGSVFYCAFLVASYVFWKYLLFICTFTVLVVNFDELRLLVLM